MHSVLKIHSHSHDIGDIKILALVLKHHKKMMFITNGRPDIL